MLLYNRFNTYIVLFFRDLNEARIYKMLYRDSHQHGIENLIVLNVFKPIEHTEGYHNSKPNNEDFPFQVKENEYVYVGNKVITFEINKKIVSYSSDFGFNEIIVPYAFSAKSIYFMLNQKYIAIQEKKLNAKT